MTDESNQEQGSATPTPLEAVETAQLDDEESTSETVVDLDGNEAIAEELGLEPELETEANLTAEISTLKRQKKGLEDEITALQAAQAQVQAEVVDAQSAIARLVQEGLLELEQRKQTLTVAVEQLERRRDRIRAEMKTSFAGVSQELAIRVQGFKDYLVGSLQDLAATAEQLELQTYPEPEPIIAQPAPTPTRTPTESTPKFAEQGFQEQARQIRNIIDQYRTMPDYYGPPWQLRRTFEPIHAERVSNWIFTQGGRGALRTMGSRLQNILIASAVISIMRSLYDERLRTLVLVNSPERLGEWRRGLQDCLGIGRIDFGPDRGVVLFEEAAPLALKADRLVNQKQLPLIIIDETEDQLINLSLLQFPLWLAFAPDPRQMANYDY